jgi:hypothetical protein
MGFTRTSIEAVADRWEDIEPFNEILEELRAKRLPAVLRIGDAGTSKVVWKIKCFGQVVLYRTVMAADGCAACCNSSNILGSVLCGRALVETTALLVDFVTQLRRLCDSGDFKGIDNLVNNRTFATKLEEWISKGSGEKGVNVLTFVDRLNTVIPKARSHYDRMSEICHPNYLGAYGLFGTLDHEIGVLHLSDAKMANKGMLHHVMAAFMGIGFVDVQLKELELLLPRVLEISEKARRART